MDVYARRRLVAVLAIVLVLVLIGVAIAGGGDDESDAPVTTVTGASTPGTATPLSKDEFIDQADDICEESAVGVDNISLDDPVKAAQDELSVTEGELDSLRSLAPPEEDQAELDDFFGALEDLVDALDTKALALDRDDTEAAAQADTEIATAKSDLADAADAYGFNECGSTGEAGTGGGTDAASGTDAGAVPVTPAAPPVTTPAPAPTPAPTDSGGTGGSGGDPAPGSGGSGSDSGGVAP